MEKKKLTLVTKELLTEFTIGFVCMVVGIINIAIPDPNHPVFLVILLLALAAEIMALMMKYNKKIFDVWDEAANENMRIATDITVHLYIVLGSLLYMAMLISHTEVMFNRGYLMLSIGLFEIIQTLLFIFIEKRGV